MMNKKVEIADLADQSERQKHLVSLMIHEIDAPINAILGKAEVILHSIDELPSNVDNIKIKLHDIILYCGLIHNILRDSALIDYDILVDTPTITDEINIRDIITYSISNLKPFIVNKKMSVEDIKTEIKNSPIRLKIKKEHLLQVFFQLIKNAVQYSIEEPHNIKIEINDQRINQGIIYRISDWGTGIPVGEETKIFEQYYKGSNAMHRVGMGNGLWTAKKILNAYGCLISLINNSNPTTFEIFIPRKLIFRNL